MTQRLFGVTLAVLLGAAGPALAETAGPPPAAASSAAPAPAPTDVRALAQRIERSSQSVSTLAGEFVQKSRIKLFKQELTSRGRFYFQRPRRIRWEYREPDPSVLVLDGERATLRSPGAPPEVFDLSRDATLRAVFDQLLLWLGSGSLLGAERDYAMSASGPPASPVLVLEPRPGTSMARAFARIELRFGLARGEKDVLVLRSLLLREASGDDKEIDFTKLERNARLPADAFR